MGYYTDYMISFRTDPRDIETEPALFNEIRLWFVDKSDMFPSPDKRKRTLMMQETKWYSHDEDMKALSKAFPTVKFYLEGVGEEFPDIWVKRYVDGSVEMARARISYEEFSDGETFEGSLS